MNKKLQCLLWAWFFGLLLGAQGAYANAPSSVGVWASSVPDQQVWARLAKPYKTEMFSKFVIDLKTGHIYYIDAHVFDLHVDFIFNHLQKQARTRDNLIAYNLNYERDKPLFILGYLTHYTHTGDWVFSFWEGDKISAKQIAQTQKVLEKTFFVPHLKFRPDSPLQEQEAMKAQALGVPIISNDTLYKAQPYQALNLGDAIGYLRIVPKNAAIDTMGFSRHDIVLLQEVYPDIAPVAGIVTTRFSTPLAHVNLRATAWGIPNAGDTSALKRYASLAGKLVVLRVEADKMTLRLASKQEQRQFKRQKQQLKKVALPSAILNDTTLLNLRDMRASDARRYGAKAANLGEVVHANLAGVQVPNGFGIPFYYYQQHIKKHAIAPYIRRLHIQYAQRGHQPEHQAQYRQALQALQQKIMQAPLDPAMLDAIEAQIQRELGDVGVFVRSSTNAEDLRGFNGAGLYDTVPNVRGRAALEAAIKKVWASVWNWRAVQERHAFGLDDAQVYPAVLIQRAVNATAAGVLVTQDIWGQQPASYTINAKWGLGMRVVEGQKIPEQIIFDTRNKGTRILSRSDEDTMLVFDALGGIKQVNVPPAKSILNEPRAEALGDIATQLIPVFSVGGVDCTRSVTPLVVECGQPLDIEWVLEGDAFWVVQVRPYVQHR